MFDSEQVWPCPGEGEGRPCPEESWGREPVQRGGGGGAVQGPRQNQCCRVSVSVSGSVGVNEPQLIEDLQYVANDSETPRVRLVLDSVVVDDFGRNKFRCTEHYLHILLRVVSEGNNRMT